MKEIPPSEFLDLLAKIWSHAGILVDKKNYTENYHDKENL
ncbi:flagellar protein FlaG [Anaerobacillus sp. HL2]|nr:flagellar protein FlaG [Anaerobacillus sp. HL2]